MIGVEEMNQWFQVGTTASRVCLTLHSTLPPPLSALSCFGMYVAQGHLFKSSIVGVGWLYFDYTLNPLPDPNGSTLSVWMRCESL